ncbi:MAG: ATP-binding protein [Nitrospirae bacterium]|nr:ATP-binding protein [Magnetococcales bacterium]
MAVFQEIDDDDEFFWREWWCAFLGSGLWGGLGGGLIWLKMGDAMAGVAFAVAVAVAGTVAFAFAFAGTVAFAFAVAFVVAFVVAFAVAFAVTGAGVVAIAVAVAGAGVVAGAFAVAGAGATVFPGSVVLFSILVGMGLFSYVPSFFWPFIWAGGGGLLLVVGVIIIYDLEEKWVEKVETGLVVAFFVVWFFLLPALSVSEYLRTPDDQILAVNLLIPFVFFFSIHAGFFGKMSESLHENRLPPVGNPQWGWLILIGLFFPGLVFAAWFFDPSMPGLETKLTQLAIFLGLMPAFFSGLIFYPLVALVAGWQMRRRRAMVYTPEKFAQLIPFRWQLFAFPLPALGNYLQDLAEYHGVETAFHAIQQVQFHSLQQRGGRLAARALATNPRYALPFCGVVAQETNARTLRPLAALSPAARAVAVLTWEAEGEPMQLSTGTDPSKVGLVLPGLSKAAHPSWFDPFHTASQGDLSVRVWYALDQLKECQKSQQADDFTTLLEWMNRCLELQSIAAVLELPKLVPVISGPPWLSQGWAVMHSIEILLAPLADYKGLKSERDRRELLQGVAQGLKRASSEKKTMSQYWSRVGVALADHWIAFLQREAEQASELIKLEATISDKPLSLGAGTLLIHIHNATATIACNVILQIDTKKSEDVGLFFKNHDAHESFLGGGGTVALPVLVEARDVGTYRVSGKVTAENLRGDPFDFPFSFQVHAVQTGRPYESPPHLLYQAGEGISDDRYFVGREHLMRSLQGLWRQPGGKPAVVLMGQRRIGKTSLLNKIDRMPLEQDKLLTVKVTIQGVNSAQDFWNETARKMAKYLGLSEPTFGGDQPFAAFKGFLRQVEPNLKGWRFLLMVDEADLIPKQKLGDDFPGYLRTLMQEPDYPVLLLFCGTHALRTMGQNYDSILFNTTTMFPVSYLDAVESHQLLQKPAQGWLEYDPDALDEVYRLTHGQPYLLQKIGQTIQSSFDATLDAGKPRDRYVTFEDMQKAIDTVVQLEVNAAFDNHWADADVPTRRVLSALARSTDERNRVAETAAGLEVVLTETGMPLSRNTIHQCLEDLLNETVLAGSGELYTFTVPMYRRWIAWRWPPVKVREEAMA